MGALSAESEQVLAIARQEAIGLRHEFTGTEHLLLGLLACDDDIAAPLLGKHGIVAVEVRAQLARPGSVTDGAFDKARPLTARAKQVLSLASREAEVLDDEEVEPEHLLLGIIRQASGVAALLLRDMGVDLAELREEVHEVREAAEDVFAEDGRGAGGGAGEHGDRPDRGREPTSEPTVTSSNGARQADPQAPRAVASPLCPSCGERLTDVVATATVPEGSSTSGRRRGASVTLIYCGACGQTLAATR